MAFILPYKLPAALEEPQPGLKWNGKLDLGTLENLRHPRGSGEAMQGLWFLPGFAGWTQNLPDFNVSVEWAGVPGPAGLGVWPGLFENCRQTARSQEATVNPGRRSVLDLGSHSPRSSLLGCLPDSPGVLGWDHPRDCSQVGVWGSPLYWLVCWLFSSARRVSASLCSLFHPSSWTLCSGRNARSLSTTGDEKHQPENLSLEGSVVSTLQGEACSTLDLVGSPAAQSPTHYAFDYLKCIFSLVTISFLKNSFFPSLVNHIYFLFGPKPIKT